MVVVLVLVIFSCYFETMGFGLALAIADATIVGHCVPATMRLMVSKLVSPKWFENLLGSNK